jgi:threonine aldolase
LDAALVETNIVRFIIEPKLMKSLKIDYFGIKDKMKEEHKILCNAGFHNDNIRLVTHRDVNRKDCENALVALKQILTPPVAFVKAEAKKAVKVAK